MPLSLSSRLNRLTIALLATALVLVAPASRANAPQAVERATTHVASGWDLVKYIVPQPACNGGGFRSSPYFDELDCGWVDFNVAGTTADSDVEVGLFAEDGTEFERVTATWRTTAPTWRVIFRPESNWPAGTVTMRAFTDGEDEPGGEVKFHLNRLGATIQATPKSDGTPYQPGEDIPVTGTLFEQDSNAGQVTKTDVAGTFKLRVGETVLGPFTADKGGAGQISETIPGAATAGLTAGPETDFRRTIAVEVIDAAYTDPTTGEWGAARAGAGSVRLRTVPDALVLQNSFTSAVGWVKPGDAYPFRILVKNPTDESAAGITVTVPPVEGTTFTAVAPSTGSAVISGGTVTWSIPSLAAATGDASTTATLVVQARADTTEQDPQIVWKDLSTTATLATPGDDPATATSHGPKVIPPGGTYDTARYGDRPFPVVPVDYQDFQHSDDHTGERLDEVINSPDYPGSTFNLFQEMSYGQLHPNGTVPSASIATADWDPALYNGGYRFTELQPQGTCHGVTFSDSPGTLGRPRIDGGWYQLPGTRDYYGDDSVGSGLTPLSDIDDACGPTAKAVWDAAHIADPEIDYSDYDTDKDGVVDFFMMVFQGEGGNGVSQTSAPPYDNIWPHSSSLEFTYSDEATGLKGYISDDPLKDHEGRRLYYTDESRLATTTTATEWPVFVRVGPYNVNPESAIDFASVISHEYGHSLGLPDFYYNDGIPVADEHDAYGTWNLMASDYSQHMDVYGRQEMGWVVPRVLAPGETVVDNWAGSKIDTDRIDWVQPDGTPYTLSGPGVANGEAYVARLPGRTIVTQEHLDTAEEGNKKAWWSGSGNDYGCPPTGGHNFDIHLPELADLPADTPVKVTMKSGWDIEWDFDYGYVMTTTDGGRTFTSHPSDNGTTSTSNPHGNSCQGDYSNGITGSSGSYKAGTEEIDRGSATTAYPSMEFIDDSFTLSDVAGKDTVLRFSYTTDAGLARPGWFVDNVTVTAGDTVLYENDFDTTADDPAVYNGGCEDDFRVVIRCTPGWTTVAAGAASQADHAYYLEMRDRSGFDFDARGQADRGEITWLPGLSLAYTDEARGYGNAGYPDPPRQSVLDANPDPQNRAPDLDDAAFRFNDVKAYSDSGEGHVDNYPDDSRDDGNWRFDYDCLTFEILSMTGDDVGPSEPAGNLTGDVRLTNGEGCGSFDYGYGTAAANTAPTADAQARPTTIVEGDTVTLDASGSSDDNQASEELTYRWDVDGDGTYDVNGRETLHRYDVAGTYQATVEVRDAEGLTDTDSVTITVTPRGDGIPDCAECDGYWLGAADGGVFSFGDATFYGSMGGMALNQPIADMVATPDGEGYWLLGQDGGVFTFGNAGFFGSGAGEELAGGAVGITPTSTGEGYWIATAAGEVLAFGDAELLGSLEDVPLNAPITGLTATADDDGYWLVGQDGGVFTFGEAGFYGSAAGTPLARPVRDLAATTGDGGYWLTAEDGGVFAYGDAPYRGGMAGRPLNGPVVSLDGTPTDNGYWLAATDGGVFAIGDAGFRGSAAGLPLNAPVVAVTAP
ncbi:MAG TPA: PKD domain-containing protein [Acidimicrobiales bacterium]|nr:PKD domain-containing protein [Acidimicrobiales bacterium]